VENIAPPSLFSETKKMSRHKIENPIVARSINLSIVENAVSPSLCSGKKGVMKIKKPIDARSINSSIVEGGEYCPPLTIFLEKKLHDKNTKTFTCVFHPLVNSAEWYPPLTIFSK
jgi:hypothetical protein